MFSEDRYITVRYVLVFLVALLIRWNCEASNPVSIRSSQGIVHSLLDQSILVDSTQQLTIEEVQHLPDSCFNFKTETFNTKIHRVLWVKVEINMLEKSDSKWIFEIFNKQADTIIMYTADEQGGFVAVDSIGSAIPFYDRNLYERMPAFELLLKPGRNVLYLRYASRGFLGLTASIQPYRSYINFANHYYFLVGGFYFVLVLLILYNFLFFISTRDRIYLYYILFVSASALDCLNVDHLGFALLWPTNPEINYYAERGTRLFFIFGVLQYASYFLSIRSNFPVLYKVIWLSYAAFILAYFFAGYLVSGSRLGLWLQEFLLASMLAVILYVALLQVKRHKPVRIFLIGYLSIMMGFTITYMFYSGWVPSHYLLYHALFFAILIDTVMFSFALSARLRQERLDKESALEAENIARKLQVEAMLENEKLLNKVNAELEEKVKERTLEIEESRKRIAEQAELIQALNIGLDKENWRLSKTIKNLQQKRAIPENLSYKQLSELFSSESDYYTFLAEYKWGEGFRCRKCGNTKESPTNDFYARRCSKCGSIESITANTIFHKLKFPLDKAFYIAYITFSSKESIKITDLSQELNLNYRTCLNFKSKIDEAIELRKRKGLSMKSWEVLIAAS